MEPILEKIEKSNKIFADIVASKSFQDLVKFNNSSKKIPRIILSGVGKNWYICEKVVKTYLSLGIHAEALDCVHALHGDLGMLMGDEPKLLIFVSKSGTTEELTKLVKVIFELRKKRIIKDLLVVGFYLNSRDKIELANEYDELLLLPNGMEYKDTPEFDERNMVPSLSINTMQMVLDYFGIELYEAHPELVKNYVYNHLGGNNGKALNSNKLVENI